MNSIATFRLGSLAREQVGERMLGVLAALLPISFIDEEAQGVDAAADVVIEGTSRIGGAGGKRVARFSAAAQTAFADNPRTGEQEVVFCDDPLVPFPFRGRTVRTRLSANCRPLALRSGDRPLAITLDGPIWSACSDGPVEHFRSALCLPRLSDEQGFVDVFNGACFLRTLVMLQFLEHVCANETYRHAPLRAAFIVDDPNLHWPRYGFVDYRAMAVRAARENYHVSFAMIPMDTWFTHRPTAALLRECGQRLSLVFHGNNHAREEMARDYPDAVRTALLHQAIGRVERFEATAGLRVDRVMVPPHGACSSKMLAALPRAGFDAACISTNSLRAHNPGEGWTATAGHAPSELVAGCPVMPRWGLTGSVQNNLLVAAYLGQALIFRGHHQDLKHGLEVFDDLARAINDLGTVHWSGLGSLCRLNHQWRMDGATYRLKPHGRTVVLQIPPQATHLCIDDAPGRFASLEPWTVTTHAGAMHAVAAGDVFELNDTTGRDLVVSRPTVSRPALAPSAPRTAPALILRRLLTEARDRLLVG